MGTLCTRFETGAEGFEVTHMKKARGENCCMANPETYCIALRGAWGGGLGPSWGKTKAGNMVANFG